MNAYTYLQPSSLSDSSNVCLRETPRKKFAASSDDRRVLWETGAAPSSVENYVASPSIMKRPLIMKATEGVPSGGITIFHAYCLTTECLQAVLPTAERTNPLCPICPLPVSTPSRTLSAHIDPFFALTHTCLAIFAILGVLCFASPSRIWHKISSHLLRVKT